MLKNWIILGYGNPDRGDDGVAYHLLKELIEKYSKNQTDLIYFQETGFLELTADIDLWFNLQLIPEISQKLSQYEKAIFLDAHTAEISEPLFIQEIRPSYKNSAFTHHLTPASCLELAEKLFQHAPQATLISVRGFSFDFSQELSPETRQLLNTALRIIMGIIHLNGTQ